MPNNTLTVELLIDIAHLGHRGDIISVSAPQARNMLIPQGKAREITPERLKQLEDQKKKKQDQARERLAAAYDIQKILDGQSIDWILRGKKGKIFGGINEHDISEKVRQKWGYIFEKHDIKLPNKSHIKTEGTHLVYLHISHNTVAKLFIHVRIEDV